MFYDNDNDIAINYRDVTEIFRIVKYWEFSATNNREREGKGQISQYIFFSWIRIYTSLV